MKSPAAWTVGAAVSLGLILGLGAPIRAQDVEPRILTPAPIGTNVFGLTLAHAWGAVLLDRALAISDADGRINTLIPSYSRYLSAFGRTSRIDAAVPVASGSWEGMSEGADTAISRTGLGDPVVNLSVFFAGAPAMSREEFRDYEKKTVFALNLRMKMPVGQYDSQYRINLGSNRWSLGTGLAVSHRVGRWALEGYGAGWFFSENSQGFGGTSVQQDPLWAVQGLVSCDLTSRAWLSVGARQSFGGELKVDGEQKDGARNINRLGAILSLPLAPGHTLKVAFTTPMVFSADNDFNILTVGWFHTW